MKVNNYLLLASLSVGVTATAAEKAPVPADYFDLSRWQLQVPIDLNQNGRADVFDEKALKTYSHPDYFYLDGSNRIVFASPNKAATSKTSTNTRSEMRYMLRGDDFSVPNHSPKNNFTVAAHPDASGFAAVGGRMEATLKVDHVSLNAGHPHKYPAYSAVIGQIHALKLKEKKDGFGYGNEPLKIFYKKWPNHDKGSLFWTYERNLATKDPNRIDISYPVWGKDWDDPSDPGTEGIALGEEFSYVVNVYENTMYLTFTSPTKGEVRFSINLADNVDANGKVDVHDHPLGYAHEPMYFKAGLYNQCSTKVSSSFRYPACPGTGNWQQDYADGNYAQATFSRLVVTAATKPTELDLKAR